MRLRPRILCIPAIAALVATGAACDKQSASSPTPFTPHLRLMNFQAKELGLAHTLCGGSLQYQVYDELTFDIVGREAARFVGGTLHHVLDDGTETLIAPVTPCHQDVTPCTAINNVCVQESTNNGGKIRAFARVAWTPERHWNVFLRSEARDTSRVSAIITRPDALPMGNLAAIAYLDARRSFPTSGSFDFLAWSPGVANRRILLTWEVWSNGVRFSTSNNSELEKFPGTVGITGGILLPNAPSELVGILEERDPNGVVIATDRKTVPFR